MKPIGIVPIKCVYVQCNLKHILKQHNVIKMFNTQNTQLSTRE